jgi:hypothetical protein
VARELARGHTRRGLDPLLDDTDERDLAARDAFLDRLGGLQLGATPLLVLVPRLLRATLINHDALPIALGWLRRAVRRSGGLRTLLRHRPRPLTFVMHMFMDAAEVAPAWALLEQGVTSEDPALRATQERLRSCVYAMAHPDLERVVPACVQHSVLDPGENVALRRLLPIAAVTDRTHVTAGR